MEVLKSFNRPNFKKKKGDILTSEEVQIMKEYYPDLVGRGFLAGEKSEGNQVNKRKKKVKHKVEKGED